MELKAIRWQQMLKMNRSFYATCLLFITIGLASVLLFSKEASSLLINGSHTPLAGLFFTYYTYFGDFEALLLLTVISLFISYRQTAIIAMSALITTIIAQSLKHILAHPRPSAILTTDQGFHIVPGIDLHTALSFPSGHTTTAFSVFTLLALFTKNKRLGFLWALMAILVGYSRIYLGQHFLQDTVMGALIGITVTSYCYWWGYNPKSALNQKPWAYRCLLKSGK